MVKDRWALKFLRLLEHLRGVFLARAWAILEIQGSVELPCFKHPVFLGEHMSLDPSERSWFREKLCVLAKGDATERTEWRLERAKSHRELNEETRAEMREQLRLIALGKRGATAVAKVAAAAAAAAAPPSPEQPLTYLPAGAPKVVQWEAKIPSVALIWEKWDKEFRGICMLTPDRHYTDVDHAKATWVKDKKPGKNFNPHIRALVRYMDGLVQLRASQERTWAEAAAIVIPMLEEARGKIAISTFCEGIFRLSKGETGSCRNGLPLDTISEALTKAPRWLPLPASVSVA